MGSPRKRNVKRNYEGLGGGLYDLRYREEQAQKYDVALLLALPRVHGLLLDNGCGTGMLLSRISSPAVGLDLTPTLLKNALERLRTGHYLILGDAEHLPLRDDVFEAVCAITLIQNTPDKVATISEMKRVTMRGGKLLLTALKAVFDEAFIRNILERMNLSNIKVVGDAGTNEWIIYAEK
jgi:ubiquinone/menaquinone biosynthesis C-methylase UbiE